MARKLALKSIRKKPAVKPVGKSKAPMAVPVLRPAPVKLKQIYLAADLAKFRDRLRALRSSLSSDMTSREKEALKAAGQDFSVDHMADFGSDNYEQEFTLGLLENDVETLRDIDEAIGKTRNGGFGLCEECGEKISRPRMRAIPHARLCVECKMKLEA